MQRVLFAASFALLIASSACEKQAGDPPAKTDRSASSGPSSMRIQLVDPAQRTGAPEIAGSVLDGSRWALSGERGKVVLVDFWATWCPPCRRSIPDLIALKRQFQSAGFEIVGVSLDSPKTSAMVAPYATGIGINYPVLIDEAARFAQAYGGVEAIPTFYLVDRSGRIAAHIIGGRPYGEISAAVQTLLREG